MKQLNILMALCAVIMSPESHASSRLAAFARSIISRNIAPEPLALEAAKFGVDIDQFAKQEILPDGQIGDLFRDTLSRCFVDETGQAFRIGVLLTGMEFEQTAELVDRINKSINPIPVVNLIHGKDAVSFDDKRYPTGLKTAAYHSITRLYDPETNRIERHYLEWLKNLGAEEQINLSSTPVARSVYLKNGVFGVKTYKEARIDYTLPPMIRVVTRAPYASSTWPGKYIVRKKVCGESSANIVQIVLDVINKKQQMVRE